MMAKSEIDRLLAKYPNPRDVRYAPQSEGRGSELKEQFPGTYGFLGGVMGTVPDEFERGSVLSESDSARDAAVSEGAKYGYPVGMALNAAPLVGGIGKLAAKYGPTVAKNAMAPTTLSKQAGVIKAPGGNWLSGSVEDALKGLKRPSHRQIDDVLTQEQLAADLPNDSLNSWIDKQLTRYVKNDMATERDPVRALAERGVLHVDPTDYYLAEKRVHPSGEALDKLGKSPWAARWENISDNVLRNEPAGDLLADRMMSTGENPHLKQNPWLAKVPPETKVSRVDRGYDVTQDLGFTHLIDELRNATNPQSGLPADLLLKYDALDKVSVPQAVERVAKINEWRAAQKAEADLARANNAATVLHKEYPEQGMKWVELKKGDLPEGYSLKDDEIAGNKGIHDATGKWLTDENSIRDPRMVALRDALKYEGDTMGHCVGGYCPDVAEGRSRIYSLRDAKGRPHVTIETKPARSPIGNPEKYVKFSQLSPEQMSSFDEYSKSMGNDPLQLRKLEESHLFNPESGTIVRASEVNPPPRVVQIKGKGNRKPNDEYLPFVQDFVKSGKWSDVGDLNNTGLEDIGRFPKRVEALGGRYVTRQQLDDYLENVPGERFSPPAEGFAKGGAVKAKHPCACPTGYADGGFVQYDPSRVDQIVEQLRTELA